MSRLAVLVLLLSPVFAATVPGRYIIELSTEPAALTAARQGHRARSTDAVFRARTAAIETEHQSAKAALQAAGAEILGETSTVSNTLFVRMADSQVDRLRAIPAVVRVYPVRMHHLLLDRALPLLHVPDAWNQIGGTDNAGAGIKIGIIDTGIDVSHPGFNDPSLVVPSGFPLVNQASDTQYTNNKIIVARSYTDTPRTPYNANDVVGHGTGVAMVAAGETTSGPFGTITGVAPKAFLGNYKVFPDGEGGAPDTLILQAINDAVADGMDVINLSLGSNPAPRPSDDVLVAAIENAVTSGLIVTVAAGNDGSNPNTIGSPAIAPDAISAGSMLNDRVFSGGLQVDGGNSYVAIPGNGPNSLTPITAPLMDVSTLDPTGLACSSLPSGSLSGSIVLILRGVCTFETKIDVAQQAGAVAALIYTDAARPNAISMATGAATLPASMVDYAVGASLQQQLASGPLNATLDFSLAARFVSPNRVSDFSSAGPSTDNGIKPDILAVGSSISTAQPMSKGGYVVEDGTSFSSPTIAGAAALLKAARPGLTVQQYRSLLVDTASPLIFDSGLPAAPQQAGGGMLNMLSAINATASAQPVSMSFGTGGSSVNQTQTLTITNLGTSTDTFALSVAVQSGSAAPVLSTNSVQLDPGQSQDVAVQMSGDGLPSGAYQGTIQIQPSQISTMTAVPYWYGIGSGTAQYLTLLEPLSTGTRSSVVAVYFRVTDAIGIPVDSNPKATVTTGSGSVVSVVSADSAFPAVFQLRVRLGAGTNVYHITAAGLAQDVTIVGQ
ncbi:MAG TPA: S8 family serine peptidase [Bryobacteraceae bacterium]|nr:S8 family serine peptidase [Bryobacteraceae bacterium]